MSSAPLSSVAGRLQAPQQNVWDIHYEALERQSQGRNVLVMSAGDPDFDTPESIPLYMIRRCQEGRTHYSPPAGEMELRAVIASLEYYGTGHPFSHDNVVIFPGATSALYATFANILNPGDEVLVTDPWYVGYQGIFVALDAKVRRVPLTLPEFQLDVDAVLAAIGPQTKAVLINTPHNPCGSIIDPGALAKLAAVCKERGLWLVCDEVYSLITFDRPHISLLKCVEDMDNIIVIDGLSKSHAMSGWRIGWTVAPRRMSEALTAFSSAVFFGVCQFVQDAAAYALDHNLEHVTRMRDAYRMRRDYVCDRIAANPFLDCVRPEGGVFVMIDARKVAGSGLEFARTLLDRGDISVIPGEAFGAQSAGYVRLSLTSEEGVLAEACDRLDRVTEGFPVAA